MDWCRDMSTSSVVKVGQYQMNGVIGKGNFAIVRLATHLPTGTKVAMKVIEKSRLSGQCLQQVLQEISILKRMNHPHIIKLYQVMQTSKLIYLVTEYASGGEIFDHIVAYGRMNERVARQKIKQIILGLVYCKQQHIIHRDLKAENLLLDKDSNVKIADFGFSVICKPGEKLVTCCGSPQYAAPELFEDTEYDGEKIDVWSLGITLYVLTVGTLPFVGSTVEEIKSSIKKGVYNIPFFMSNECEDLIRRLLCYDPVKRISLLEVIDHKWICLDGKDPEFQILIQKSLDLPVYNADSMINPHIIALMQKLNFTTESILTSLREKKFDNNWATYHILLDKHNKEQTQTISKRPSQQTFQLLVNDEQISREMNGLPEMCSSAGLHRVQSKPAIPPMLHLSPHEDLPPPEVLAKYLAMRRNTCGDALMKLANSYEEDQNEEEGGHKKSFKPHTMRQGSVDEILTNNSTSQEFSNSLQPPKSNIMQKLVEKRKSFDTLSHKAPNHNLFLKIKSPDCLEKDYRTVSGIKSNSAKKNKVFNNVEKPKKKNEKSYEAIQDLVTPFLKSFKTMNLHKEPSLDKDVREDEERSHSGVCLAYNELMSEHERVCTSL